MILVLFPLSFSTDPAFLEHIAPGCIWIATLFSSLLSIQHFFAQDLQDGFLQQCVLARISLTIQVFAKFIAHWLMHIIPLLILTCIMAPLFHLSITSCGILTVSLLLGTPILMLIGILCAALTIGLRQQGVMMGVLIFPLIIPTMIFAINMVIQFNAHISILGPLSFLAGLCLLTITIMPCVISAALKLVMSN
jgi:heme exporter protein B